MIYTYKQKAQAPAPPPLPRRLLVLLVLARLVLVPSAGAALLWGAVRTGAVPRDPLLIVAVMVEQASPTAMNMGLICSLVGQHQAAAAQLLFVMYVCAVVTLTGWTAGTLIAIRHL